MAESIVESSTEAVLNVAKTERIRVLHVDDDQAFLKVAKQCLEMQGEIDVDTASSVYEASEKLEKTDYDAIVCDYQMPGKDGLEFLKELRANGNTVPFIVFTGKGREEIAVKALNLGADQYVDKHGDPETVYCELAHNIKTASGNKKAEDVKRRSEERYRTLLESISDSVYVLDREWRHVIVNEAAANFTRTPREKLLGNKLTDLFPGVEKTPFFAAFKRVMETRKPETVSGKYVFEDGREGWCEVHVYPVPEGILCISTDIASRKKTEEELRNSEERLSILFELAPDAYYLNDLRGNFIDGNKAAEEVTGYTKNELIGKSFLKLKLLARSQALKAAKLLAMNALGKPTGPDEFVLNRKDGAQVPVEIRTHPVKIKGKTLVLGIARDITIRKKDEQAILENQQKFEGLFRHNPEAAVYLGLDFKVLDVNPRFCELFGYSEKEVEGKHINEVVVPEDMIEEAETLDKDAKKGHASRDTVRKRKGGSLVHVSISATPVTIEGRLFGYVGVYKDITDLKNAGEHLKEINKKLEVTNEKLHVVGGLTRHDVRNKLSAVTGNAYLLRRKLTEDPKALEQLADMEAAVRLVEQIFEFARNYEKLGVEQLACMDVGKAVDGAVSLFSDLKGVKIVNECEGLTALADSLLSQLSTI